MNIKIRQINHHLSKEYFPYIVLSRSDQRFPLEQQKSFKFTRALCGLAISMNSELNPSETVKYITDGFGDNGLDAVYYNPNERTLYLVQAKYNSTGGQSIIDKGDALKFVSGVEDLLLPKYDKFNDEIKSRKKEIEGYLLDIHTKFKLIVISTGSGTLSGEVEGVFEEFLAENNEINTTSNFSVSTIGASEIYTYLSRGAISAPIDSEIALHKFNKIDDPIKSYYGLIAGSDLVALYKDNGRKLFAPNIRVYLGDTEVNDGIIETLTNEPDRFWYYNNGITALCDRIEKKPIGGNTTDIGLLDCTNIRIVNGAQTVGSMAVAAASIPDNVANAKVAIRLFQVHEENHEESKTITRTNNTQNRIESRDFVSLDPQQERISDELAIDKIIYVYKSGEFVEKGQDGFDLTEAAIARACHHNDVSYSVIAKREVSRLWNDIEKPPYKLLFNSGISGLELFESVKIFRKVEELINDKKANTMDREKLFATHGNRFILHLVFQNMSYSRVQNTFNTNGREIEEIFAEQYSLLYRKIEKYYSSSVLGSLFKNFSKCRDLAEKVKE
ncbi:hypothetical protein GGR28_003785 [Lewinella aquimaris]|uniref:Abortive phage infection protein C-terminal domain-containing protein n=1 Tax=Neolewinella aquimaris TaxID=1835722 RepID=A0A840EGX7_9BACT|nr:AIPR family protein [Neolewinella aquimaris]MBB4081138.1 hypothetical protein [Neolewinella aquimaris]